MGPDTVIRFGMCIFGEGLDLKLVRLLSFLDSLGVVLTIIQMGRIHVVTVGGLRVFQIYTALVQNLAIFTTMLFSYLPRRRALQKAPSSHRIGHVCHHISNFAVRLGARDPDVRFLNQDLPRLDTESFHLRFRY